MPFFNPNDDTEPPWRDPFKGRENIYWREKVAREGTRVTKFNPSRSVQSNRELFSSFLEHPLAYAVLRTPTFIDFTWSIGPNKNNQCIFSTALHEAINDFEEHLTKQITSAVEKEFQQPIDSEQMTRDNLEKVIEGILKFTRVCFAGQFDPNKLIDNNYSTAPDYQGPGLRVRLEISERPAFQTLSLSPLGPRSIQCSSVISRPVGL